MDLSDEAVYLVDVRSTFGDSCISPDLELVEIANPSKPRKNTGNVQYILFQSLSSKPQEKKTKQRTWPDEPEDGGHRPSPPSLGGSGRKSGAAGSKTTDGTSMQNKQVAIYLSIYIYILAPTPHSSPLIPYQRKPIFSALLHQPSIFRSAPLRSMRRSLPFFAFCGSLAFCGSRPVPTGRGPWSRGARMERLERLDQRVELSGWSDTRQRRMERPTG